METYGDHSVPVCPIHQLESCAVDSLVSDHVESTLDNSAWYDYSRTKKDKQNTKLHRGIVTCFSVMSFWMFLAVESM